MRRITVAVAALALTLAMSTACGGEEEVQTGSDKVTTIDITITGDSVSPNGDRVAVEIGQPIELVVKAEKGGELHVHSTPEQELAYGAGTTTLTLTIDKPGVVDVEAHDLEQTIVQLEVR